MNALASGFFHITALAFGLLTYVWVLLGVVIGRRMAERFMPEIHDHHANVLGFWFMVAGAALGIVAWNYWLPGWWKAMVPGFSSAIAD